jgi:hypothetical protein
MARSSIVQELLEQLSSSRVYVACFRSVACCLGQLLTCPSPLLPVVVVSQVGFPRRDPERLKVALANTHRCGSRRGR